MHYQVTVPGCLVFVREVFPVVRATAFLAHERSQGDGFGRQTEIVCCKVEARRTTPT
jgi:hypothetical protein